MGVPTPREAADQAVMRYPAMAALPCFRRLVDHARATDPGAGGGLSALREWVESERDKTARHHRGPFKDVLDEIDRRLAAAPEAATEGGDRWITSAAAANRLPTGTVVETDAGHRGIVTEHGHGRYLMWSSGPEKSWRACVLFVATPRAEGEAAAWAQHLDDTAAYAGGFTEPERAGIRAAARMLRDPDVQAQVAKTVGGES